MTRRTLTLLLAAAFAACNGSTPPPSTCPADGYPAGTPRPTGCVPGPGWIAYAFTREGTSNPALFISKADGSCAQRVTGDGAFYGGPAFFPGGQKLAYASTRSGSNQLYLLDLLTGAETALPTGYSFASPPGPPELLIAATPAVSPDGTTIAFEGSLSAYPGWSDLFTVPASGGNVRRITSDPAAATLPHWSPDGSRLYYLSYQAGQDLYSIQADGSGGARVTTGSSLSSKFDVSGAFKIAAPGLHINVLQVQQHSRQHLTGKAHIDVMLHPTFAAFIFIDRLIAVHRHKEEKTRKNIPHRLDIPVPGRGL